jgi:hypothetical protein
MALLGCPGLGLVLRPCAVPGHACWAGQAACPSLACLLGPAACRNLGCANLSCNLCKLCQRRRCEGNFAAKYLAPCDVVEAKCGAQIYVVVVDLATGALVQQSLDDAFLQVPAWPLPPCLAPLPACLPACLR